MPRLKRSVYRAPLLRFRHAFQQHRRELQRPGQPVVGQRRFEDIFQDADRIAVVDLMRIEAGFGRAESQADSFFRPPRAMPALNAPRWRSGETLKQSQKCLNARGLPKRKARL